MEAADPNVAAKRPKRHELNRLIGSSAMRNTSPFPAENPDPEDATSGDDPNDISSTSSSDSSISDQM